MAEAGPAINPIEQFSIHPVVPISIAHTDFSLTNSGLYMLLAVALGCLVAAIGARGDSGRSRPPASAGRDELRVHRRHGSLGGGRSRDALFPAGFQHLLLHPDLQSGWSDPLHLRGDRPDRDHRGACAPGVLHRGRHWRQGARDWASSSCSSPRASRFTFCRWSSRSRSSRSLCGPSVIRSVCSPTCWPATSH